MILRVPSNLKPSTDSTPYKRILEFFVCFEEKRTDQRDDVNSGYSLPGDLVNTWLIVASSSLSTSLNIRCHVPGWLRNLDCTY